MRKSQAIEQFDAVFDKLYRQGRIRDMVRLSQDTFYDVVVHLNLRVGLSYSEAEDAAQETFFGLWQSLDGKKYKEARGNGSKYIFSIAKKKRADIYRGEHRKEDTLDFDDISSDEDLETIVSTREFLRHVEECIAELSLEVREALESRFLPNRKGTDGRGTRDRRDADRERKRVQLGRETVKKCLRKKGISELEKGEK